MTINETDSDSPPDKEPDIKNPKDVFLLIKSWRHTLSMGQMLGQGREMTSKVISMMMEFENKNKKHIT